MRYGAWALCLVLLSISCAYGADQDGSYTSQPTIAKHSAKKPKNKKKTKKKKTPKVIILNNDDLPKDHYYPVADQIPASNNTLPAIGAPAAAQPNTAAAPASAAPVQTQHTPQTNPAGAGGAATGQPSPHQ